jgi:integrase
VRVYTYPPHKPTERRSPAGSIGALVEAHRRSPEWLSLAPRTRRKYEIYIRTLDPAWDSPVSILRRRFVLHLRDRIADLRGPAAADMFVVTVRRLVAWAVEREAIEFNPLARVKHLPGGYLPAWSEAQYILALPALPEPLRRAAVLARHTGQRHGDLIAMRWSQYDGRSLRLTQRKTGAALVVPATDTLRAELDDWRSGPVAPMPERTILVTPTGLPWRGDHLSESFRKAVDRVDPALAGFGLHGLRKLAASSLAEAGCSVHEPRPARRSAGRQQPPDDGQQTRRPGPRARPNPSSVNSVSAIMPHRIIADRFAASMTCLPDR